MNKLNLSIIGAVLLFTVLACANGGKTETQEHRNQNEQPIPVTAEALTRIYENNEVSADDTYRGRLLIVTGEIENIADTYGNLTVSLKGHDFLKSVMCSFDSSRKQEVARLAKGRRVTIEGRGDGMTGGLYVGLENCTIR